MNKYLQSVVRDTLQDNWKMETSWILEFVLVYKKPGCSTNRKMARGKRDASISAQATVDSVADDSAVENKDQDGDEEIEGARGAWVQRKGSQSQSTYAKEAKRHVFFISSKEDKKYQVWCMLWLVQS